MFILQLFIRYNLVLNNMNFNVRVFFLWNLNFRQVKILGIRLYNIEILAKTFECRHSSHVEFTFSIIWPYTAWSWFSAVHQEFSQMAKMEYICQGYIKTSGTLVFGIDVAPGLFGINTNHSPLNIYSTALKVTNF